MSGNLDFIELSKLMAQRGYEILQNEWLRQTGDIEQKRDKAAKMGQESAWRYWAGMEAGFKLAITTLDRTLARIEEANQGETPKENIVDKLLKEIQS